MELHGAVAIITGGSRGLGRAIAEQLRTRGALVHSCGLTTEDGGTRLDVCDRAAVDAFVQQVHAKEGRIDLLVNNAGWSPPLQPLEQVTDKEYERCMDTNVAGVFHFLAATLPHFKKQGSGAILNICSRAGTRAHPGLAVYSASKFAVRGLTQAIARELQDEHISVRCLSISPGGIATGMREELFGVQDAQSQQTPERVAELVLQALQDPEIPHGADVQIVRGEITNVVPLS